MWAGSVFFFSVMLGSLKVCFYPCPSSTLEGHTCHGACVEVRGQLMRVGFTWVLGNSDVFQIWWQMPLPAKPSFSLSLVFEWLKECCWDLFEPGKASHMLPQHCGPCQSQLLVHRKSSSPPTHTCPWGRPRAIPGHHHSTAVRHNHSPLLGVQQLIISGQLIQIPSLG